jgi:hypothetical protein
MALSGRKGFGQRLRDAVIRIPKSLGAFFVSFVPFVVGFVLPLFIPVEF